MASTYENPPLSAGALVSGLLFGGWIVLCDVWIKLLARSAGCEPVTPIARALDEIWQQPGSCPGVDVGGAMQLKPALRTGIGPADLPLPDGTSQLWGLALLAVATVVSILVLRWRWRIPGDALALGALWAGFALLALPRLAGPGAALTELHVGGLTTGLADIAVVWSTVWLAWRFIAELRA